MNKLPHTVVYKITLSTRDRPRCRAVASMIGMGQEARAVVGRWSRGWLWRMAREKPEATRCTGAPTPHTL